MLNKVFPSTDELRTKYKEVFNNKSDTELSNWTDTNCSEPINEAAYLEKAMEIGSEVFANIKRSVESIGK